MTTKEAKSLVRGYLHTAYTDNDLTKALDHMRSGQFHFISCCCFIGIPTATHALQTGRQLWMGTHYNKAMTRFLNAEKAHEGVIALLKKDGIGGVDNGHLTRRLIPMILHEIKRRQYERMAKTAIGQSEKSPLLQETTVVGR